jgi:hypothetical protein
VLIPFIAGEAKELKEDFPPYHVMWAARLGFSRILQRL